MSSCSNCHKSIENNNLFNFVEYHAKDAADNRCGSRTSNNYFCSNDCMTLSECGFFYYIYFFNKIYIYI